MTTEPTDAEITVVAVAVHGDGDYWAARADAKTAIAAIDDFRAKNGIVPPYMEAIGIKNWDYGHVADSNTDEELADLDFTAPLYRCSENTTEQGLDPEVQERYGAVLHSETQT